MMDRFKDRSHEEGGLKKVFKSIKDFKFRRVKDEQKG
jgi:hypothetical protein